MATERMCLVVADISGYTEYLAGVELDHAQDVLADLLTTVVHAFRPRFKLSKVEGDAAFVYAPVGALDGSILLDKIEGSYFQFRQRLLSIRQASTCRCQACALIPNLDLKIIAHHGEAAFHTVAGRRELVGTDVILVHRLLKNSISGRAYAFLSDACISATALDPEALGMQRHTETFEHVGEVGGWVHDLERAWKGMQERRRVYVSEADAALSFSAFYPAPPDLVWEFISSPTLRPAWTVGLDRVDQLDPGGRRRPGTQNHCVHGDMELRQEFVDWRPPRYHTSKVKLPDGITLVATAEVEPAEGGAVLHERFKRPPNPQHLAVLKELGAMLEAAHPIEVGQLTELLVEAQQQAAGPEPEPPSADEQRRQATAVG